MDVLTYAMDRRDGRAARALAPLTASTAVLTDGWTPRQRAEALWRVIQEGVLDPDVSPTPQSRRRRVLHAALRLRDADIPEPWGSSLTERFKQLKALRDVFNSPNSTQPMEIAWRRAVSRLATHLADRFEGLQTAADWEPYRLGSAEPLYSHDLDLDEWQGYLDNLAAESAFRETSKGAQPVLVNLFVTTVFMKKRAVYRRITERLITARADGVRYYTARGLVGESDQPTYVSVRALWGCREQFIESSHPSRPPVTRLWFPEPLSAGQQVHFASEVIDENISTERLWINVDIDHHGIVPGLAVYGGQLPISGLTIRVRFDDGHLPEAIWWYAELTERERYDRPPPGDPNLLSITGSHIQHTFTGVPCQPRESYGLAFSWPSIET